MEIYTELCARVVVIVTVQWPKSKQSFSEIEFGQFWKCDFNQTENDALKIQKLHEKTEDLAKQLKEMTGGASDIAAFMH